MFEFDRPEDVEFGHTNARIEQIPLDTIRDYNVRREDPVVFDTASGGAAGTSFNTPTGAYGRPIGAYGRPIDTPVGEDEYVDVFDTSWMPPSKLKVLAGAANDYYKMLKEDQGLKPEVPDLSSFVLDRDSRLRLKEYPDINLINENTGRPNKLTTTASNKGGREIVRKHLCFSKWTPEMSKAAEANLRKNDQSLKSSSKSLDTGGATEAVESTQKIIAVLASEGYTSREILGMCKALERSRGEHTNNLAKLSELDKDIAVEESKLEEATDETTKNIIAEGLRKLQNERGPRLEAASSTREALRSQISRIRETLHRILHEDKTLAERIRTLFREQGITIVSILTALGMIISTIVLAIPGGSGGGAAPPQTPQPPGKGGAKEWIKKQLQSLGRILAKLAGKAAAALPGIIGSIVSWLLSLLGKTAVWLSSNLWAVLLAVGGLLLVAAREWLLPKKPKQS